METIESLAPADTVEIARIIHEVHESASYPVGPKWTPAQIAEECRGQGWVLRDAAGRIGAFILLRDAIDAWEITFLATAPTARRSGYMRKLLSHVVNRLPEGRSVWLEVHEANAAARQLYQGFDFRQVGRRPKYYADGGTAVLYSFGATTG